VTPVVHRYTDEIHEQLGYWATWLPGKRIRLGDCGPIRDREFKVERNLKDFGIPFKKAPSGAPGNNIVHSSAAGVEWEFQAAGGVAHIEGVPPGKAGVAVRFSRANAIVLVVHEPRESQIADIYALREALLERTLDGEFPESYAVVTSVVDAGSTTVLISNSGEGLFSASAEADLAAGPVDLANAKLALQRVSWRGLETEVVAEHGLTPLFQLAGFKKGGRFRGKPDFKGLAFEEDPEPGTLAELAPGDTDPD